MTGARRARRARQGWLRGNVIALGSLLLLIPVAGWTTARTDFEAWRATEPRDPVTVEQAGTGYADATWYPAAVEVDPAPVRDRDDVEELPPNTVRVRVHLMLKVTDLAMLEEPDLDAETSRGVTGCTIQLRAPDGRIWKDADLSDFKDRPSGCAGGTDEKPMSFRPKSTAQHYLKPKAGEPFEVGAVFVVPKDVAGSVEPIVTWPTRVPQYLRFPRR